MERNKYCFPSLLNGELDELHCRRMMKQSIDGSVWHPTARLTSPGYLIRNLIVAAGAFALTFALAMVIPWVGLRYLAWLRR